MHLTNTIFRHLAAFLGIFMVFQPWIRAQLYEVPLDQRIQKSSCIFQGKVLDSESFWGSDGHMIFTSHLVRVDLDLTGNIPGQLVEVVTEGGTVGDESVFISHNLEVGPGQRGIFFCNSTRRPSLSRPSDSRLVLEVYANVQGLVRYFSDGVNPPAADPFHRYQDIRLELCAPIRYLKGLPPLLERGESRLATTTKAASAISITDFYPDTVTAGTRTVLTIVGTEFGDSAGSVLFANADDGGLTMMQGDAVDILYWSPDTVRVYVPSVGRVVDTLKGTAGTGVFSVRDRTGNAAPSGDTLWVRYALTNRRFDATLTAYPVHLIDTNHTGGYTFQYTPGFVAIPGAKDAFEWALRRWRCATGVNFVIGADTNLAGGPTDDNICTVHWSALSPGELGRTVVRSRACFSLATNDLEYFSKEIDISFDSTIMFSFDTILLPSPTMVDFASVTLHELGHAHLLQHVIESDSLMHYAASAGQVVRDISVNQFDAASIVIDSSVVARPGCPQPMLAVSPAICSNVQLRNEMPFVRSIITSSLFPNPFARECTLLLVSTQVFTKAEISVLDIHGRTILNLDLGRIRLGENQFRFNLADRPNGIYLIVIRAGEMYWTEKIVKRNE